MVHPTLLSKNYLKKAIYVNVKITLGQLYQEFGDNSSISGKGNMIYLKIFQKILFFFEPYDIIKTKVKKDILLL